MKNYEITINYIDPIKDGFAIGLNANIGFGRLTVHGTDCECETTPKFEVETECMCSQDNKEFIRQVFEALTKALEVIE